MFGLEFETVFVIMMATAALLLFQAFVVPAFGENGRAKRRMKSRLREVVGQGEAPRRNSLVREKYLKELPIWAQRLESLPGMESLGRVIEQAGRETPSHRLLLKCIVIAALAGFLMLLFTQKTGLSIVMGVITGAIPLIRLHSQRNARLADFEEQFPDALSTMSRALKAGYPFTETLKLVASELDEPVAREFEITFNDVNYGGDLRSALSGLLLRIPSVTVMAFVSAVTIQKDTGGNLAELFDKLERVIRGRYKFKRTLKTLTAEGRLAAWIMSFFPVCLGAILSMVNPDLMPMLLYDPTGQKLIITAFFLMMAGILWMRKIVRVDV